jgi:mycothiol synthase
MSDGGTDEPCVTRSLDEPDRTRVRALLGRVAKGSGTWPLSDQLAADLDRPALAESMRPISVLLPAAGDHDALAGYAQASRRGGGWTMQVVVDPSRSGTDPSAALLDRVLRAIGAAGGGDVDWWVFDASADTAALAAAHGFAPDRDLKQMRRPLPAERRSNVATRAFVTGQDEDAWLAVNNRAFAGHAEQGGWTLDTLRQRMDLPWFDADGFRLHERDGRLAGFCWTKLHDPGLGEIYVIGVDPDYQGLGLGRELTLAGLDHMADRGVTNALLYVDGDNRAALALYERLGFEVSRTDLAFRHHQ